MDDHRTRQKETTGIYGNLNLEKNAINVSWTEKRNNVTILPSTINRRKRITLSIIKERSSKLLKHLLKHNVIIINIFEGRINGYKGRGRSRKTFIVKMVKLAVYTNFLGIKRLAVEREE